MKRFAFVFLLSAFYLVAYSNSKGAKVLNHSTKTIFNGQKIISKTNISIQINSRSDLDYCEVTIPFDGLTEVSNIKANLADLNGKIIDKLKKKDISIASNISDGTFYEDSFVYSFYLSTNQFPAVFNYSFETTSKQYLYIEHWTPYIEYQLEVEKASLELELPKDFKFHLKLNGFDSVQPTLVEGKYIYKWEGTNYPGIKKEAYMPSLRSIIPLVIIVPYEFYFNHSGSFESWSKYGEWESKMLVGLNELPENEKTKINEAIKDAATDLEKIEILFKRLQEETRYINISENVGGMKPHSASYVAKNKFGDCKALSNYFKAVLDFAGIDSYYTNINAGDKINPIDIEFPSQQFNHVILMVPLENDSLWIDCTSDLKCGYVGTFIQNRNAFIIDGENSFFKKTPELEQKDVEMSRLIFIQQTPTNDAKIKVRNSYKGDWYETLFYVKNEFDKDKKIQILNEYLIEDQMETPDQIIMQTFTDPLQIVLDYTSHSNTIIQKMGNDIVVNIPELSFPSFERPKYRDYNVQINYPIFYTDQITFEKPFNKKINHLPKDEEIKSEFGYYSLRVVEKEDQINIYKSFYLSSGNYSISQYEDFYNFIKASKKLDHKLMITTTN